jgi:hypothetical protein
MMPGLAKTRRTEMKKSSVIATILLIALTGSALSGVNTVAKVAVHVMEHSSRSCTKSFPSITECEDIVFRIEAGDADCFPVFFNLWEFQGLEYGLDWPGTYSCVFTSCSDLAIGDIVDPGDGVSHAWSACQNSDMAVPGWAWITEPDSARVCVVMNPETCTINIGDCHDGMDHPSEDPYCAGIAGADGDDPCGYPTAAERSTWGTIKSLFQ